MSELTHEQPMHVAALAGAIERLTIINENLADAVRELERRAWPFRDGAVKNEGRLVSSGSARITFVHATNELAGATDAYLQFFDENNVDAVKLGQTKPEMTLWLPANGGDSDPWVPPATFDRGIVIAATSTRDGAGAAAQLVMVTLLVERAR